MTRWLGVLVHLWGWASLVVVVTVLAAGLGVLVATAAPGALPLLGGSILHTGPVVLAAVLLAAPFAVTTAVALDQVLPAGNLRDALGLLVAALDGVPALVVGVVGAVLAPALGPAVVIVVLALAIAPSLTVALAAVLDRAEPEERLAAQALGATPLQVLLFVVGPASAKGFAAAGLRALARLVGIAAPLVVLSPEAGLPIAGDIVHRAASGYLAAAATLALGVLALATALRVLSTLIDRPDSWSMQ